MPAKSQIVRIDLDLNDPTVFEPVPPFASMPQSIARFGYLLEKSGYLLLRSNVGKQQLQEFIARITVVPHGGIVDLKQLKGFQVVDPHRLRAIHEQDAVAGVQFRWGLGRQNLGWQDLNRL
jgi:hypothetical protein